MSMNPARTFGSGAPGGDDLEPLWIYFAAPPLGMLLAGELYVRRHGLARVSLREASPSVDRPLHLSLRTPWRQYAWT